MTEKKLSARYCPCCGEVTAVEKGKPSPWEPVTRKDIEDLAALRGQVATLREALQECITEDGAMAWRSAELAGRRLEFISSTARAALAATAAPKDQEARHE